MQCVVFAGASGFIGRRLVASYREGGDSVTTIGRGGADVTWSDVDGLVRAVDGADLLVNLAGRTVNCRYTPENRAVILDSRVETTRQLSDAVRRSAEPPGVWMNSARSSRSRDSRASASAGRSSTDGGRTRRLAAGPARTTRSRRAAGVNDSAGCTSTTSSTSSASPTRRPS